MKRASMIAAVLAVVLTFWSVPGVNVEAIDGSWSMPAIKQATR